MKNCFNLWISIKPENGKKLPPFLKIEHQDLAINVEIVLKASKMMLLYNLLLKNKIYKL